MSMRARVLLSCALLCACLGVQPGFAQDAPAGDGRMTLAQAEKQATGLRQGMTIDEVQKLLGKPIQTSLKSEAHPRITPSKGILQWSYAWGDAASRAYLRVTFGAENLESETYRVTGWQWTPN